MGTWVRFRKVREDDREVEYRYGQERPDRTLVIQKATLASSPTDGTEDPAYHYAATMIFKRRHEAGGTWPDKGMAAS